MARSRRRTTRHPHSNAATWRARIVAGEVEVEGRRAEPDQILRPGQVLVWHRPPWHEPAAAGRWRTQQGAADAIDGDYRRID